MPLITTRAPLVILIVVLATALVACSVESFSIRSTSSIFLQNTIIRISSSSSTTTRLCIKPDWFTPDDEGDEDDENNNNNNNNPEMVTREMLHRDLLSDPQVKRKQRKNGKGGGGGEGYRPLDNRDYLPFAVKKMTPDPYTHPETKQLQAKNKTMRQKKTDLDHQLLADSRLYTTNKKGDTSTLLGEFKLDKSTTSGDVIVIGEKEFEVQKARCQYKYAGGQRFVMIRKVLEVKEVTRVQKEEFLLQQYQKSESEPEAPLHLDW